MYANNSPILNGNLKNYVADLASKGYSVNYPRLRIGDTTSGASGQFDIVSMEFSGEGVTPPALPIPEPASIVLIAVGLLKLTLRNISGR